MNKPINKQFNKPINKSINKPYLTTGIVRAHARGAASHRQVRVYAILLPRLPRGEAGVREVGHVLLRYHRPQTRRRRPYRRVRVVRVVRVVGVVREHF